MTDKLRDDGERFELDFEDETVFADYRRTQGTLAILHVEAPPALRGTGAAGKLMRAVAEQARAEGATIKPYCGYAAAWLRRHREYHDLVA
jgi:predicted GNAT family acetyltransferase